MAPRGETRSKLIQTTARLIQQRGLHGTGLLDVLEESGAPRGSLYFHFPQGKSQLAAESVDLAAQVIERRLRRAMANAPTVSEGVATILDRYASGQLAVDFSEGCAVAGVALDLAAGDEMLRSVCAQALANWRIPLVEALQREGHTQEDARALATTIIAMIEGGLLMSRVEKSVEPFEAAKLALTRLLSASAGPGILRSGGAQG